MQWAEGGSLDDFIDIRTGRTSASQLPQLHDSGPSSSAAHATTQDPEAIHSRSARIRAFRAMQHTPPEQREHLRHEMASLGVPAHGASEKEWKPVHLFSAQEVKSLFSDVVEGLAFLVSAAINSFLGQANI